MKRQRGATLAELIVAAAVGMLVMLMAGALLVSANAAYVGQVEAAAVDDSGRYALEIITRAARQAAFVNWERGEAGADRATAPPSIGGLDARSLSRATEGIDSPLADAVNGSDVLALRYGGAADGSVISCAGFAVDEADDGWSIFYVGRNAGGDAELRCKYRGKNSWGADAIIGGVDTFQVLYGLDTDSPADGVANEFVSAAVIDERDAALVLAAAEPLARQRELQPPHALEADRRHPCGTAGARRRPRTRQRGADRVRPVRQRLHRCLRRRRSRCASVGASHAGRPAPARTPNVRVRHPAAQRAGRGNAMMRFRRHRGAALLTALFVVLALTIIGVAAAHTALNAEKSARNERDRHIAFQAAEAALIDAERDIEGVADPASARAALFAIGSALGFAEGCGRGPDNLGLCMYSPTAPAWQVADLAGDDTATPYGRFTGALLPTGGGALPGRAPRYVIELMPLARAGEDAGRQSANVYRITAIGFGVRPTTHVVLQSFYRKVVAGGAL